MKQAGGVSADEDPGPAEAEAKLASAAAHESHEAGGGRPPRVRSPTHSLTHSLTHHEPAKQGCCRLKRCHPAAKALQGLHRQEDGACSRQGRAGQAAARQAGQGMRMRWSSFNHRVPQPAHSPTAVPTASKLKRRSSAARVHQASVYQVSAW